jgi:hypothetical protein
MHHKLRLLISLVSLSSVFFLPSVLNASTLSLSPATGSFNVNDTISVNLQLNTQGAAIDGVDIHYLNYNPSLLELIDEDTGTAGIQILHSPILPNIVASSFDTTNGRVAFSQITNGGVKYSNTSSQSLATLRFRALSSGTAALTFDAAGGSTLDTNVAMGNQDTLTSAAGASFTIGGGATPQTVLSDNFESALSWTQAGDVTWYTGTPRNGARSVRLRTTGSIERAISLQGFQNISVSFNMGANSLDNNNENLQALYFDGSAWQVLAQINNGSANENNQLNPYSLTLPASVNNLATFALRFKLNGNGTGDQGYIDDVVVTGTPSGPASTKFDLNDRVQVSSGPLNVRSCASTSCTSLGTQPTSAQGIVIGGPTAADGFAWWQVNFDSGVDGWSVENFLEEVLPDTTAPPTPTNLQATSPSSSQVDLTWSASTDAVVAGQTTSGVTGYRVYRDGNQVGTPTGTSYSDTGLTQSSAHSYTVAAVDAAGNVSAQSAPVNSITTTGTQSLSSGDRITTTANLNVRSSGTINSSVLGTQPVGVQGTLTGTPVTANGYTWWSINYDSGVDGWSVDAYLSEIYPTLPTVGFNQGEDNQSIIARLKAQIVSLQSQLAGLVSQLAAVGVVGQ